MQGSLGYRPGPAVHQVYELPENELPFWDHITCGVELRVGRDFNHWAYGPSCEGYSCPLCNQEFEPDNEDLADVLSEAIGQWIEQSGPALVPCPSCKGHVPVTEWRCQPPLGFGNLSVVFWNWPPLDSCRMANRHPRSDPPSHAPPPHFKPTATSNYGQEPFSSARGYPAGVAPLTRMTPIPSLWR